MWAGFPYRPWRPARHHRKIRQFFSLTSLRDRSHPLSSWEQRVPWQKIQQSTSDGGDGRRDGDATATEMNGTTAKRLRRDADNDATVRTGGGSMATARRRQRRRRRRRRRRCMLGGGSLAVARWRRRWWWRHRRLGGGAAAAAEWRLRQHGSGGSGGDGGSATARQWWWCVCNATATTMRQRK
jgi:hypothetical protein